MPSEPPSLTAAAFGRALDAVRGLKILGSVRKPSAMARFSFRALSAKKWLELAVDRGGYCAIKVFKHPDDVAWSSELRFVGSSVKVVATTELPVDVPGWRSALALHVSGVDLRREDGRPAGDVFFFARDQRELTQITLAVNALSKSSLPDGSCRFSLSGAAAAKLGPIEKHHVQLVNRACVRILAIKAAPKGLLTELAQFADKDEASKLLDLPDVDYVSPELAARALIESLERLPRPPLSAPEFDAFAVQVSTAPDVDGAIVVSALETLLTRIGSVNALKVVQLATRAAGHIAGALKSNTLREIADELGPLLVQGRPHSDALVALLAACISPKHRDKVFLTASASLEGPPGTAVVAKALLAPLQAGGRLSSSSSSVVDAKPEPSSAARAQQPAGALEGAAETNLASQEDIEALVRLHNWLSARLEEDPAHANAELWRQELQAVQAEASLHMPTVMLLPPTLQGGRRRREAAVATPAAHPPAAAAPAAAAPQLSGAKTTSSPLLDSIMVLWADVRKMDGAGKLNLALDRLQQLAENVQEDDVPDAAQRATTLALVSLLEENVRLRLRMAMVPEDNGAHKARGSDCEEEERRQEAKEDDFGLESPVRPARGSEADVYEI